MIQVTEAQHIMVLRLVRDYRAGRDERVKALVLRRNELEFMRFCNKMAKEFEMYMPPMSFGELSEMHMAFRNKEAGSTMAGIDFSQWDSLSPEDVTAVTELTGCALGLRRMAAGDR